MQLLSTAIMELIQEKLYIALRNNAKNNPVNQKSWNWIENSLLGPTIKDELREKNYW